MEELGIKIEPTGDATNSGLLAKKPLEESDYYTRFQELKKQIEFYDVQEEYIKDEMRNLRKEYLHAQEEVKHYLDSLFLEIILWKLSRERRYIAQI